MDYPQTRIEEQFNSMTHAVMALMMLILMPFAASGFWQALPALSRTRVFSTTVFCLSMILMFGTSAVYHYLPADSRFKRVFNRLDHVAIYFAIAGTYTPVALLMIGGKPGLALLLIEWLLVLSGIAFKTLFFKKGRLVSIISTGVYLAMGWAILPWAGIFISKAQPGSIILIVTGGLSYTIGVIFFALKRRFAHVVWHLFVNAGAMCHFLAIVILNG